MWNPTDIYGDWKKYPGLKNDPPNLTTNLFRAVRSRFVERFWAGKKGVRKVKALKTLSKWLVVIGAVNWGLVAVLDYNLVTTLFGLWPAVETWVYVLVGLAGLWGAYAMLTNSKKKK